MKKIVTVMCIAVLLSSNGVMAEVYNKNYAQTATITLNLPDYTRFYQIDSTNISAKYVNLSDKQIKNLDDNQKDLFKKVKKIEKYISKNNYKKALDEDKSFMPTHIQYLNYSLSSGDYHQALSELLTIQQLNNRDKIFDNEKINYKLGMLYYLNKNYPVALNYLSPFVDKFNPSKDNLWLALSEIHYNLNNFSSSVFYAKKILSTSQNYLAAQEFLYNSYYSLNNFKEANIYAKNLVNLDPTPINYMRFGTTSSDSKTKLSSYYKARNLALASKNYTALGQADLRIAAIEQGKINDAVKTLTAFVTKPDWDKILKEIIKISEPDAVSERQKQFFEKTNACIAKYGDRELIKCFEAVNAEQEKLTTELKAEYQRAYDERQRELEFQRQQMLIREQTYYNRMYMDDFWYMRHPYRFGYW